MNKRNRTGKTYIKTDIRYDVIDTDGVVRYAEQNITKAAMYCAQNEGWTYEEVKYNRCSVGATARYVVHIPFEMRQWIVDKAYSEETSCAEIIRRCIQAQMDNKRNRFYIPLF